MAIAGLRGTGDWATDERPKNFRELILWRSPNGTAPLTALLSKMKAEKVDDPEFSWWEEANKPIRLQVNGVINTTTTTVIVVDAEGATHGALNLVPGDILIVETGDAGTEEIVRVNGVANDTTFDVIRAQAGTTAAAIPDNTYLTKIGNAFAEGTTSPSVSVRNPTKKTNYCQIFKTAYELTKTAEVTRTRTGDSLKNDKKRRMFDHSAALEFAFMFGKPYETTGANNKPMRFTGGLRHFVTTNRTVFTTTPTETTFLDAVQKVFDYEAEESGNERLVLGGNGFYTSLNKLAKSGTQLRAEGTVRVYGMELQKWVAPQGTYYFKTHPLMNVHGRYTNSAWVLAPSAMVYRYLRDTTLQDNIQAPDADERKGQWLTEAGLEFHHEVTMAYVGNFVV